MTAHTIFTRTAYILILSLLFSFVFAPTAWAATRCPLWIDGVNAQDYTSDDTVEINENRLEVNGNQITLKNNQTVALKNNDGTFSVYRYNNGTFQPNQDLAADLTRLDNLGLRLGKDRRSLANQLADGRLTMDKLDDGNVILYSSKTGKAHFKLSKAHNNLNKATQLKDIIETKGYKISHWNQRTLEALAKKSQQAPVTSTAAEALSNMMPAVVSGVAGLTALVGAYLLGRESVLSEQELKNAEEENIDAGIELAGTLDPNVFDTITNPTTFDTTTVDTTFNPQEGALATAQATAKQYLEQAGNTAEAIAQAETKVEQLKQDQAQARQQNQIESAQAIADQLAAEQQALAELRETERFEQGEITTDEAIELLSQDVAIDGRDKILEAFRTASEYTGCTGSCLLYLRGVIELESNDAFARKDTYILDANGSLVANPDLGDPTQDLGGGYYPINNAVQIAASQQNVSRCRSTGYDDCSFKSFESQLVGAATILFLGIVESRVIKDIESEDNPTGIASVEEFLAFQNSGFNDSISQMPKTLESLGLSHLERLIPSTDNPITLDDMDPPNIPQEVALGILSDPKYQNSSIERIRETIGPAPRIHGYNTSSVMQENQNTQFTRYSDALTHSYSCRINNTCGSYNLPVVSLDSPSDLQEASVDTDSDLETFVIEPYNQQPTTQTLINFMFHLTLTLMQLANWL